MNKTISCSYHAAVINTEGKVICWGYNENGQCNVPEGLVAQTGMVVLM